MELHDTSPAGPRNDFFFSFLLFGCLRRRRGGARYLSSVLVSVDSRGDLETPSATAPPRPGSPPTRCKLACFGHHTKGQATAPHWGQEKPQTPKRRPEKQGLKRNSSHTEARRCPQSVDFYGGGGCEEGVWTRYQAFSSLSTVSEKRFKMSLTGRFALE